MYSSRVQSVNDIVQPLNRMLDQFSAHLRNQAIRAGVVAACMPIEATFKRLAAEHVGQGTPTRHIRGTNIEVARRHMKDAISHKIWRVPNGNGYIGFIGPVSVEVPHSHWFERGPKNRQTKAGEWRGSMQDYHLLSRTFSSSIAQAERAFEAVVIQKIASFQGS
jgi:hypothetical protein